MDDERDLFEAGVLDRDRREACDRLRALELCGDSYSMLSAVGRAIYPAEFGWTVGAANALRDTLVHLIGGSREREVRWVGEDFERFERRRLLEELGRVTAERDELRAALLAYVDASMGALDALGEVVL